MRTGRSGVGKRKSFDRLIGVKPSNNIVGGRDLSLYCRCRGKCNIAEKYKFFGFGFAADYRDP